MPRLMFDAQLSSEWRTRPFEKTNTKTQNLRKCACWNGSQRQLKTPKTRATVQTPTDCHITQLCCTAKWHRQNRVLKLSSLNDNDYWMNLFMQFFGLLAPARSGPRVLDLTVQVNCSSSRLVLLPDRIALPSRSSQIPTGRCKNVFNPTPVHPQTLFFSSFCF